MDLSRLFETREPSDEGEEIAVARTVRVPLKEGIVTFVGYLDTGERPRKHGNELHLVIDDKKDVRCRNMSSENFEEVRRRWPDVVAEAEVDILVDGTAVIVDERLPPEWRLFRCDGCGGYEPIDHACCQ